MFPKDHYRTLGVLRTASPEDIRQAFRKLARAYHPDLNRTANAENKFKSINEAYEILRDSQKRAEYDEELSAFWRPIPPKNSPPPPPPPPPKGHHGKGSGFHKTTHHHSETKAEEHGWFHKHAKNNSHITHSGDIEVPLILDLEDAYQGGMRTIDMNVPELGGRRILQVNIPRGIESGRKIKMRGEGMFATQGHGKRGDLYLVVEIAQHPRFRLEGRNLVTTLNLTPWEAALGGKVPLETLTGKVMLHIPTGSSSGRHILIRGRGMPGDGSHLDGDMLVELKISVPKYLNPEEEALFRKLASRSSFDPRQ